MTHDRQEEEREENTPWSWVCLLSIWPLKPSRDTPAKRRFEARLSGFLGRETRNVLHAVNLGDALICGTRLGFNSVQGPSHVKLEHFFTRIHEQDTCRHSRPTPV